MSQLTLIGAHVRRKCPHKSNIIDECLHTPLLTRGRIGVNLRYPYHALRKSEAIYRGF
jgi:hypothetical protein